MTADQRRRLMAGPLAIELTAEKILEDLCWPGRPPGQWRDVPAPDEQAGSRAVAATAPGPAPR